MESLELIISTIMTVNKSIDSSHNVVNPKLVAHSISIYDFTKDFVLPIILFVCGVISGILINKISMRNRRYQEYIHLFDSIETQFNELNKYIVDYSKMAINKKDNIELKYGNIKLLILEIYRSLETHIDISEKFHDTDELNLLMENLLHFNVDRLQQDLLTIDIALKSQKLNLEFNLESISIKNYIDKIRPYTKKSS